MTRTIQQTSLDAYFQLLTSGTLHPRNQMVLEFIGLNPYMTDMEITKGLGFNDPNQVRPRRKELLDAGHIVDAGTRKCTITGRMAHIWVDRLSMENGKWIQ